MDANEIVKQATTMEKCLLRDARDMEDGLFAVGESETLRTAATLIESLRVQLAASQQRERAAVEDLVACMHYAKPKNNNTCNFCSKDMAEYPERCKGREDAIECCPKWRGPQQAGEGERDG